MSVIVEGYLESLLKDLHQLKHLELGVICKHDDNVAIPDDLLDFKNLNQIEFLTLHTSWNKEIVDVNTTALFRGLKYMTGLKWLSISLILYQGFRKNGATELYKGLKQLFSVNELALQLDLCWESGLGDVTVDELNTVLKKLSSLLRNVSLCIDFNFSGLSGPGGV